jgi:hypothetical protein
MFEKIKKKSIELFAIITKDAISDKELILYIEIQIYKAILISEKSENIELIEKIISELLFYFKERYLFIEYKDIWELQDIILTEFVKIIKEYKKNEKI